MEVVASIIAGLLIVVGIVGIIIPVLPGSVLIIATLLVWALTMGDSNGWIVFAIGSFLCSVGLVTTFLLQGSVLRREQVPNRSMLIAMVVGLIGMFVLPAFGLPLGFVAGLWISEYARQRDWRVAGRSSWQVLRATGIGIVVEFFCASATLSIFVAALLVRLL